MFHFLGNKTKNFTFYEIKKDLITESETKKISKEVRKYKHGEYYYDVFVFEDTSYIVFSDFKILTDRDRLIVRMISLLIYAFSKKKDIKVFEELIFKVKENINYKKIILKFDDTGVK